MKKFNTEAIITIVVFIVCMAISIFLWWYSGHEIFVRNIVNAEWLFCTIILSGFICLIATCLFGATK